MKTLVPRLPVSRALLALLLAHSPAEAGVALDGTLGSTGSLSGNMTVPASVGRQVGANLFHSFRTFSILTGESLYFTPAGSSAAISNVISRVTGGSLSSIDGTLGSTIAGANVFLINPSGITFGPNARLDVSGSFHASTANYLKLADGGRFDATTPENTVLTVATPAAFGFLGPAQAGITVSGSTLRVPNGQSLGLIGGDVGVSGTATLAASGGRIHLVSGGSAGEAVIASGAFDVSSFSRLGTVSVRDNSLLNVTEPAGQAVGGGTIYIRGGSLVLDNSELRAWTDNGASGGADIAVSGDGTVRDARIDTSSAGPGRSGDIRISAGGTLSLDNSTITSETFGDGNAGNVLINSGNLVLSNAAKIDSSGSFSVGRGGDISINATGTMSMDNARITSRAFGDGDAGKILVNTGNLGLANGAQIDSKGASFGAGRGGDILINATGTMSMDGSRISSEAFGDGNAGTIQINAGILNVANSSRIDSSGGIFGVGRGGNITIGANSISMNSLARISSEAFGDGDAGNVFINAGSLDMAGGARIDSSSALTGAGRGGNVTISATGTFSMNDAKISSQAYSVGDAGHISISAGSLNLGNSASINSSGVLFGAGHAGNIAINAGSLNLASGATIDSGGAVQGTGRGGNVTISATTVSADDATITADAWGDGNAGNVLITTGNLYLVNGARINSRTFALGRGGDIAINASGVLSMDGFAKISSEAFRDGNAGNVVINAGGLDMAGGARIDSSGALSGIGRGGNITISTTGTMSLNDSTFSSQAYAEGDAGHILISAGNLSLSNFSGINSTGAVGRGGNISVNTGAMTMDKSRIASEAHGDGDAGNILINANRLDLRNFSDINSSTGSTDPFGVGRGGNVTIGVSGTLSLDRSRITSESFGDGNAGNILINAARIGLTNSSQISSAGGNPGFFGQGGKITVGVTETMSMDNSRITSEAFGDGNAGNILINAGRIALTNSSEITSAGGDPGFFGRGGNIAITTGELSADNATVTSKAFGEGDAGNIVINAGTLNLTNAARIDSSGARSGVGRGGDISIDATDILMANRSGISAQNPGIGIAGDIRVFARDSIRMLNGSAITTEALLSDGGNIDIAAGFMIHLKDSRITTSVGTGFGNGGNITIDPVFVILDNSRIIANAYGGRGGNISIVTQQFISDPRSVVDASSALGIDGNVEISSPNPEVGANLGVLPAALFDASALMRGSCAARAGTAAANSFIGVGRGGLPTDPDSAAYSVYGTLDGAGKRHGDPRTEADRANTAVFLAAVGTSWVAAAGGCGQ